MWGVSVILKRIKGDTYNTSLKSPKTYICLKLSIAMTGQSAGVFWICRRGCLNLSQSACKKFIVPLKEKQNFENYIRILTVFSDYELLKQHNNHINILEINIDQETKT